MSKNDKYSLVGVDGNAFAVMGYVTKAMRREGKTKEEMDNFRKQAMSGDYNNVLNESQDIIDRLNDSDI